MGCCLILACTVLHCTVLYCTVLYHTVPQVREAYRRRGWALLEMDKVEQCHKEG